MPDARKPRVLLIEPNRQLRDRYGIHLSTLNCHVIRRATFKEALLTIGREEDLDLVVTSLYLVGEDEGGVKIARAVRRDHPCAKIVMLSDKPAHHRHVTSRLVDAWLRRQNDRPTLGDFEDFLALFDLRSRRTFAEKAHPLV